MYSYVFYLAVKTIKKFDRIIFCQNILLLENIKDFLPAWTFLDPQQLSKLVSLSRGCSPFRNLPPQAAATLRLNGRFVRVRGAWRNQCHERERGGDRWLVWRGCCVQDVPPALSSLSRQMMHLAKFPGTPNPQHVSTLYRIASIPSRS